MTRVNAENAEYVDTCFMQVLMVTSEWPTPKHPEWVPFIVQQVRYLRKTGVNIKVFHFRGQKNPINYMKAWFEFHLRYDFDKFDLIHAQFGQAGLVALPCPIPLVVTYWGSDIHGIVAPNGHYTLIGRVLQQVSRFVAQRATEVIVVSGHLADFLPVRGSIHVIPHGVDLTLFRPIPRFEARQRLGLPMDKRLILFAANPRNPVKRYPLAQRAVELLPDSLNAVLLALSGVPHERVPLYMNACDVLLLTSRHEGSPTVVKEALACNLPVVSVDVGDVRERIGNVEGCVVCEDDAPQTIARALEHVLRNYSRVNGREAVADLDEQKVAERIIEVYRAAIGASRTHGISTE